MTIENNQPTPTPEHTEPVIQVNPADIRKNTTKSILSAVYQATGNQFNSVEEMINWSQLASEKLNQKAPEPEVKARASTGLDSVQEELKAMKEAIARKDHMLRERDTNSMIQSQLQDQFEPELQEFVISKVKEQIKYDGDRLLIKDENGNTRYNLDTGNVLTVKDLVQEIGRKYPKTLKSQPVPEGRGPGIRSSTSIRQLSNDEIPDYATNPAEFKLWAEKNGIGSRGIKGKFGFVSGKSAK